MEVERHVSSPLHRSLWHVSKLVKSSLEFATLPASLRFARLVLLMVVLPSCITALYTSFAANCRAAAQAFRHTKPPAVTLSQW